MTCVVNHMSGATLDIFACVHALHSKACISLIGLSCQRSHKFCYPLHAPERLNETHYHGSSFGLSVSLKEPRRISLHCGCL